MKTKGKTQVRLVTTLKISNLKNSNSILQLGYTLSLLGKFSRSLAASLKYASLYDFQSNTIIIGVKQGSVELNFEVNSDSLKVDAGDALSNA